ncbi:hypothetical protein RRG08_010892 [Elysia crispata]|uniref:Uncharacterized protein n=1 Tax=Elysia crispata TaxID=231223 RepID=A0AAE0ZZS3_9GAST|nr:hypothetical protein RRG08_010892 [Elysia crispata]
MMFSDQMLGCWGAGVLGCWGAEQSLVPGTRVPARAPSGCRMVSPGSQEGRRQKSLGAGMYADVEQEEDGKGGR